MIGNKIFVDTNIILYLLNGDETMADLLDGKQIYISFITELELLSFKNLTDDEQAIIKSFISECKIIDINRGIKDLSIFIRKKYHIKLPDAIIAATTKYMDLPLITADKGFKQLENLSLIFYEI